MSNPSEGQYYVDAEQVRFFTKVWLSNVQGLRNARINTMSINRKVSLDHPEREALSGLVHTDILVVEGASGRAYDFPEARFKILKRRGHTFWVENLEFKYRILVKIEGSRYRG